MTRAVLVPAARRAGLTLLELLLVMVLLSGILGTGLGMFAALDLGQRQALGLLQGELRAAQNAAVARRAPARVRFERASGRIVGSYEDVVGTWHFERADYTGAFGLTAGAREAVLDEHGYLGRCVRFESASPGAGGQLDLPIHRDPANDFERGFALELALWIEHAQAASVFDAGGAFGLELERDGALVGWFSPRVSAQEGGFVRGPRVRLRSAPLALAPRSWVRVRLEYDGAWLALYLDGRRIARAAESSPVHAIDGPARLSDRRKPLVGRADALVLSAVRAGEDALLPDGVQFGSSTVAEVRFAAGGGLDRAEHAEPVRIELVHRDASSQWVQVNLYGTIE